MHNSTAGSGDIDGDQLQHVLADAGHEIAGYHTVDDDDWEQHIGPPDELLVVAGGDGTVRKVFLAAVDQPLRLAIVPTGTANNIARSLGLDVENPLSLPAGWVDPMPVVHLDVPTVLGADGPRRFLEGAGGGLFAEAMRRADQREADGHDVNVWAILAGVLDESDPGDWNIDVDGEDLSGGYLAVYATNISYAGPSIPVAPDARPDDGLLDLVLVSPADREGLLDYAAQRQDGRADVTPPAFATLSGRRITLVPPANCALSVDDLNRQHGWFAGRTIRVENVSGALAVVAGSRYAASG